VPAIRWLRVNIPYDDYTLVHPVLTLHWAGANDLRLLREDGTLFANGGQIDSRAVPSWPIRFRAEPLAPTTECIVRVLGEADNVTGEKAVDTIHARVVNVDLDVDANHDGAITVADEPLEETAGGYVCVGTNSLTPITLTLAPKPGLPGKLTLSANVGDTRIKVWQDAGRTVRVTLPKVWIAGAAIPGTLHVEGITPSAVARDVELRLEYDENPAGQSNPLFKCEDRVRLTVLKVDLITPAGDPTNAPVGSGDGQNEFTFSTNTPGVLEMNLKAEVSPTGVATQIKDQCLFSVDAIAGSTLAWDAANPGGKPTASNDFLLATVRFSGLPSANSALGAKKAAIFFNGAKCDEESCEVFFPKSATNHPGGQAGSPNWYFYWSQTTANGANTTMVYTNGPSSYYDYFAGRTIFIDADTCDSHIAAWGTPQGIDCFAWVTAHEAKHHTQLTGFWPTNWVAAQDIDSDWLPNNQETNYMPGRAYSPTNAATFPDTVGYGQNPIPDYEDINMRSQTSPYGLDVLWSNGTANAEDWANPGKNSATTY